MGYEIKDVGRHQFMQSPLDCNRSLDLVSTVIENYLQILGKGET